MTLRTGFQIFATLIACLSSSGINAHDMDLDGRYSPGKLDLVDWEQVKKITILFDDNNYVPEDLKLTKGQPYIFEMKNIGGRSHDFVHLEFFHNISIKQVSSQFGRINTHHIHSLYLRSGENIELHFVPNNSGEFEFFCSIEGHREDGMEGFINIVD